MFLFRKKAPKQQPIVGVTPEEVQGLEESLRLARHTLRHYIEEAAKAEGLRLEAARKVSLLEKVLAMSTELRES